MRHENRKDWSSSEQSQPGWKGPHWLKRKWNRLVIRKWRRDGYDGTSEPNERMLRWFWD